MHKLTVNASNGQYDILTGQGLIKSAGRLIAPFTANRAAIISDTTVAPLYAPALCESLKEAGIEPLLITVASGEASKSAGVLAGLWERLAFEGFTRSDAVIALGGGVVGDLAGFAAATYLRGVPFIQVPTTLLAMADSSVGGKVAIDLDAGKNLAGSFYQPLLVLQDVDCLKSLDRRQLRAGMAEVIKTAALGAPLLFEKLERAHHLYDPALLPEFIASCCGVKAEVVASDPLEKGRRMILNFGHTLGHALEKEASFSLLHGEAVALGMTAACRWGEALGETDRQITARVSALIEKAGLPTAPPAFSKPALLKLMRLDKKNDSGKISIVILKEIGYAITIKLPMDTFEQLALATL